MSVPKVIKDIRDLRASIKNLLSESVASNLNLGDEVYIEESGVLVPFLVVQKNYLASNNVILVRKQPLETLYRFNTQDYNVSSMHIYLEYTYKTMLNVTYSTISLPYIVRSTGTLGNVTVSTFLPSATEMTGTSANFNSTPISEGSHLTYFTNNSRRIAMRAGAATHYMTRTPASNLGYYYISTTGDRLTGNNTTTMRIRPAISIAGYSTVLKINNLNTNNTLATATLLSE